MSKPSHRGTQLPLPVLGQISGPRAEAASTPKPAEDLHTLNDADLSSWPPMEASDLDKAIFESIAANYFRSRKSA